MKNISVKIILILLFGIWFSSAMAQEISKADSLERALFSEESPHKKMDIIIELTDLILSSNPDRAIVLANQTVNLAVEHNNHKNKLLAWLQLTEIYWSKTDLRSSIEIGNKAKSLAVDLDMEREYAESLILLSKNFSDLGDYEKSSELKFQALKIFDKLNDKKGILKAFSQIGKDHFEQRNIDKAFEYFSQSLSIAKEINDLKGISQGLNNVAAVYAVKGEYEHYLVNIKEAVKINKKIGQRLWEGINYSNLGSYYGEKQKFDTSLYNYNMAVNIYTELNNLPKLASVYTNMSNLHSNFKNLDSSLYYANLAYDLGIENSLNKTTYSAAKRLHTIYFEQNDTINAYIFSTIEHQMKDSLDIKNNKTRLSQLELLYEFEKIEQENKIKGERRDFKFMISGISIVFLFILLVYIIITRNRMKAKNELIERRKLSSELEIRSKELTSNVMILIRKNELLSDMADKLMDIQNEAVKKETKSAIKKIAKELERTTDNDIWDEFETRFKQVHGEFYEKLISQFPELSPNELKICAFLRLNMTTKEISELTGQGINSIEIARTRLRKKLGITNTKTNLISFISQI